MICMISMDLSGSCVESCQLFVELTMERCWFMSLSCKFIDLFRGDGKSLANVVIALADVVIRFG